MPREIKIPRVQCQGMHIQQSESLSDCTGRSSGSIDARNNDNGLLLSHEAVNAAVRQMEPAAWKADKVSAQESTSHAEDGDKTLEQQAAEHLQQLHQHARRGLHAQSIGHHENQAAEESRAAGTHEPPENDMSGSHDEPSTEDEDGCGDMEEDEHPLRYLLQKLAISPPRLRTTLGRVPEAVCENGSLFTNEF